MLGQNGCHQKVYTQSMLERVWRKGSPLTLLVGCKLAQPLWRTVWRFLKKLEAELPYDPAIPLLGIYIKGFNELVTQPHQLVKVKVKSVVSDSL